ncbi:MAG: hypothetical protein Q9194_001652 [Teloschistes cf. exilis]
MALGSRANTNGTARSSGPGDIDDTTFTTFETRSRKEIQDSALLEMLGGYYDRAKVAVVLTLLLRVGAGGLLGVWGYRRLQDRAKLDRKVRSWVRVLGSIPRPNPLRSNSTGEVNAHNPEDLRAQDRRQKIPPGGFLKDKS